MKNTTNLALVGAFFALVTPVVSAANADCATLSASVRSAVVASPENVLEIVSKQVAANEDCAGVIVKAAIIATEADKALVAQIVETAITAAPKKMRLIETCALAVAPDAHAQIAAISSKYTSAAGESVADSKGGDKGGMVDKGGIAPIIDVHPLDFANGGGPVPPIGPPPLPPFPPGPPVITPPDSTEQ